MQYIYIIFFFFDHKYPFSEICLVPPENSSSWEGKEPPPLFLLFMWRKAGLRLGYNNTIVPTDEDGGIL